MARYKNALRGHFIAEDTDGTFETPPTEWLELAKWIQTVEADNNEETEDLAFYDGDGTPETEVISVAIGNTFTGFYDSSDPAQALVAEKEFETGSERKIWYRRVSADGEREWVGRATLSGIVIGGGDASAYETFECNVRWDRKPEMTPPETTPPEA